MNMKKMPKWLKKALQEMRDKQQCADVGTINAKTRIEALRDAELIVFKCWYEKNSKNC